MTTELLNALRQGVTSTEYFRLLQNYGYWAHTAGCKGYGHGGDDLPTPVISDETALEIDRAVGVLKERRPNLFSLFKFYYINQYGFAEIMSILRRRAGKPHYHSRRVYNPAVDGALRYANMRTIVQLLHRAEEIVFLALKGE